MKPTHTLFILAILLASGFAFAQTTVTFSATGIYVPPAGVTSIKVGVTGGGGGGGGASSATTAGGGGGGGAYAEEPALAVTPGTSYAVILGGGGQCGTNGTNGENGVASTFDASRVVGAGGNGGIGATTTTAGTGGVGGLASESIGTTKFNGGSGAAGVSGTAGGGGGGSAGCNGVGGNAAGSTGGAASTGCATAFNGVIGGAGGTGAAGAAGVAGGSNGAGGGGGSRGTANTDQPGGNGALGRVKVTYTCPTYSLTGTAVATYSTGNGATVTLTSAAANLPVGTYTVTYNLSGANTATGATSTFTITSAGSGTFTTTSLTNLSPAGTPTTITITNLSSGSPASVACGNTISASNTASFNSGDFVALSGGNWDNSSNWSINGTTTCSCIPNSTSQVTIQIGTIQLNVEPIVIGALNGSAASSNIKATPATLGAVTNFTVGNLNLNTTFAGSIINNTSIATTSNINFTKVGTGTLTLSGTNTFKGTTTVSNGTLSLASNTALGNVANTTTVSSGAAININGAAVANAITLGGTGMSSTGALTGTGTASLSGNVTTTSNFSIGGTGTLTVSGIISGANRLEKVGTGTLVLSGTNTFSNGTKISAGTLTLGKSGVLVDAATVDLAGGTFSSGFSTGFSETMGNISLSGSSTLALGTGVHSLNFANKGSFTQDKVLTITGWTGGYDGTSGTSGKVFISNTLLSGFGELSQIWFFDGVKTYPAIQLGTGEIVPTATACPSIPAAPITSDGSLPACADLTPLTSITLLDGKKYGVSAAGSCSNTSVTLSSGSLQNGNSLTKIYIKAGETFTMDGSIATSFLGSIYVMAGGTFNLTGDINGGSIYVYGTFNHALGGTARNQGPNTNPSKVYVASGGTYNAGYGGGSYEQGSSGTLYVEGTVNISKFDKFQGSVLTCINNSGCFNFTSVNAFNANQTASTGFQSGPGYGSLYYLQTSCPSSNANFSNSPNLRICAPNIPASSVPCARFGAATVYYGAACAPSPSNCAGVVALPITLNFFKATATKEGVISKWGVSSQWNSDYFIIEKSQNGIDWEYVGTVKSTNEISKYREFSLLDENPYQGGSYYKLVEVNKDGERTTYSVVYIEVETSELELFSVYPNPTSGELTINILGEDVDYDFTLIDVLGKTLFSKKLSIGINSLGTVLNISGIYFARLKIRGDYKVVKVVKQ